MARPNPFHSMGTGQLGHAFPSYTVTAETAILEDSPFSNFPSLPFSSVLLSIKNSFGKLFYPSPTPQYSQSSPSRPSFFSRLFNSVRGFFSGNRRTPNENPRISRPYRPSSQPRHYNLRLNRLRSRTNPPSTSKADNPPPPSKATPPLPVRSPEVQKLHTYNQAVIDTTLESGEMLEEVVRKRASSNPSLFGTTSDTKKLQESALEQAAKTREVARQLIDNVADNLDQKMATTVRENIHLARDYADALEDAAATPAPPPSMETTEPKPLAPIMITKLREHLDQTNPTISEPRSPPCPPSESLDDPSPMKWNPGCRILAQNPLPENAQDTLFDRCLGSLKARILEGQDEPVTTQDIHRSILLNNMLNEEKINPIEQRFLAMVFTSFGETSGSPSNEQERTRYKRIMRVIDNRTDKILSKSKKKNIGTMDTVLTPWQFSIYNPTDPSLIRMIRYQDNVPRQKSMKNAVLAYIQYENNKRIVPEIPPQTMHFVAHSYRKKTMYRSDTWYYGHHPQYPPRDKHHAFYQLPNNAFPLPYRDGEWFSQLPHKSDIIPLYAIR